MGNAGAKRRVSSAKAVPSTRNRGQVLKFDRHAGLVMMERGEPAESPGFVFSLVRNLLSILRLIPRARGSDRSAKAQRIR